MPFTHCAINKLEGEANFRSTGSDSTASMIKGGGYVGAQKHAAAWWVTGACYLPAIHLPAQYVRCNDKQLQSSSLAQK